MVDGFIVVVCVCGATAAGNQSDRDASKEEGSGLILCVWPLKRDVINVLIEIAVGFYI